MGLLSIYESFLERKMIKRLFTENSTRATECLEHIHSDVCEPFKFQDKRGCEYFVNLKDDYLFYSQAYLIRHRFDTFEMFKEYRASIKK